MTISILIVSHAADLKRLEYCLHSIDKFVSGYEEVVLAVPTQQKELFEPLAEKSGRCRLYTYLEWPGRGFLHHCVTVCYSDVICGTDYVLNLDSDCIFTRPTKLPEDICIDGLPVLFCTEYDELRASKDNKDWQRVWWKKQAERALGQTADLEYMMGPPHCFGFEAYSKLRNLVEIEHGKPFHDYVMEQKAEPLWGFADIDLLGSVSHFINALRASAMNDGGFLGSNRLNRIIGTSDPEFQAAYAKVGCIKRFWSRDQTTRDFAQIEDILSRGQDGNQPNAVVNPSQAVAHQISCECLGWGNEHNGQRCEKCGATFYAPDAPMTATEVLLRQKL